MGRWGFRVVLVVLLLATALASLGAPGASAEAPAHGDKFPPELRFDGFGSSGQIHRLDTSTELVRAEKPRTPQIIIGPDTRAQVTDTTVFPYSAIAHLELYEEVEDGPPELLFGCSAAFIGPNVLLTAAHCLWDDQELGGYVDRLVVVPGANGGVEPFGFVEAQSIWVPDTYFTDSAPGSIFDYGLIVLGSSEIEAQTGSFEVGILTTSELQDPNFDPTTAGYPGDKPFGTQWTGSEPAFTSVGDDRITHEIDSVQGQSGSPVWRASDMAIVAVESAETDFENFSVRLDVSIMYEFMAACQQLGCRINHFLTDVPGDGGAYDRVWQRTDFPVSTGTEPRTWMWGPQPISRIMFEPYAESPNGFRTVLYQEKSRMEITTPDADPNSIWYVTNGLATVELMTGNLQLGNDTFEQHEPAQINVAGDGDDPDGPTYTTFAGLRSQPPHGSASTSGTTLAGSPDVITATVDRAGTIGDDPSLASHGVTAAHYVPETQHTVASVFWDFMNSSGTVWQDGQYIQADLFDNAFFATGFPVTEAYWATVRVGGTERTVLVQAFERRVLTYTPGNPPGFEVEAGNVGSHYLQWLEQIHAAGDQPGNGGQDPPIDQPPAAGALIADADLANWPEVETTFGDTGAPSGDSYRITNPPGGFLQILPEDSFSDGYFTVETRAVQASPEAGASCILYRADPVDENPLFLESGYWFCLFYEGGSVIAAGTVYETTQDIIELGGAEFLEPLPAAADWHQIGVAAQGSTFWFVVNNTVLGSLEHDLGPGSGQVGILAMNFGENPDGPDAVYEFRNLEIYDLINGSGPPPPDSGDDPPAEGDVLYQSSLGDLPAVDGANGAVGEPASSGNGYLMAGPPGSVVYAFDTVEFGDASYELDVLSTVDAGATRACLVIRSTPAGAYHLCLDYGGGGALGSVAFYIDTSTPSGALVDLGTYVFSAPLPADELISIKVITSGADYWFYAAGQYIGSASHGSGATGGVGLAMLCFDETDICSAGFGNLTVRSLVN